MRVFRNVPDRDDRLGDTVCTVGNFDGVHRAHQDLLREVQEAAVATGHTSALVTFDPHPSRLLTPDNAPPLLTTVRQKLELIERASIDVAVLIPFDRPFAALSPERFGRDVLVGALHARRLFVGPNFFFGRDRRGDVEFLRRFAATGGPEVTVIPPRIDDGEAISSSRIRAALAAGDLDAVHRMLGRPYRVDGKVVTGQHKGKLLGIPTANLALENEMVPPDGVYVTEFEISGRRFGSVTNIGQRPTFPAAGHAVETHILDFDEQIYGEDVRLRFLARLRDERRFPDLDALREQIGRDIDAARRLLAHQPEPPPAP